MGSGLCLTRRPNLMSHSSNAFLSGFALRREDSRRSCEGEEDIEDKAWAALKKRRLLPGTATSDEDFRQLSAHFEDVRSVFQNEQPDVLHGSDSTVQIVLRHKTRIANKYPNVSAYMTKHIPAGDAPPRRNIICAFTAETATSCIQAVPFNTITKVFPWVAARYLLS
ncbi:unnamed protein product [Symbiodinium sp. CCMP2456]|nr:unnamed protein product [Symbiodinium sp. CCMP2456]